MTFWKYFFVLIQVTACFSASNHALNKKCCSIGAALGNDGKNCLKYDRKIPDVPEENQLLCKGIIELCCNQERLLLDCKLGVAFAKSYQHCMLDNTTRGCSGQAETCCSACLLAQTYTRLKQECKLPGNNDSTLSQVFYTCCPETSNRDDDKEYETYDDPNSQNLCEMFPRQLCAHNCVPSGNSYFCQCREGYSLMEDQKSCQQDKVKPKTNQTVVFLPNPEKPVPLKKPIKYVPFGPVSQDKCTVKNHCDHECQDTDEGQICGCRPGYELSHDHRHCKDINECLDNIHVCDPSMEVCVNEIGGYKCIDRNVSTTPFIFRRSTTQPPALISETTPKKVEQICRLGYWLFEDNCIDVDECVRPHPDVCYPREKCTNTIGGFECSCEDGFHRLSDKGPCVDINECQLNQHNCLPEQRCDNSIGSYQCHRIAGCGTGYTLNVNSGQCEDDDECALGTDNCRNIGQGYQCRNTQGSFKCERRRCSPGDINCTSNICPKGFRESHNGQCADLDECKENMHNCHPTYEICHNRRGSFECRKLPTCPKGYDSTAQGCVDVDECARGTHTCDRNGICQNYNGGFSCICRQGYQANGTSCLDIDECSQYGCPHFADCQNTQGSYRCNCKQGYLQAGDNNCQDEDECSLVPNICDHHCTNVYGSYRCSCKNGFYLHENNRSCIDVDECTRFRPGDLCLGECVNTPGSFACGCPQGYNLGGDGRTCQDIDECARNPCRGEDEVCLNTGGSYACNSIACPPGYVKDNGQKNRCRQACQDRPDSNQCRQKPSTLSFNFITFVSKLPIPPIGHLDLFAMRGPPVASSDAQFELSLHDARSPQGIPAATRDYFHLRHPGWGQAVVALVRPIEGPQQIELELTASLYQNGVSTGQAIAKLFIHVSQYEY